MQPAALGAQRTFRASCRPGSGTKARLSRLACVRGPGPLARFRWDLADQTSPCYRRSCTRVASSSIKLRHRRHELGGGHATPSRLPLLCAVNLALEERSETRHWKKSCSSPHEPNPSPRKVCASTRTLISIGQPTAPRASLPGSPKSTPGSGPRYF
jgi:hypothetical protein